MAVKAGLVGRVAPPFLGLCVDFSRLSPTVRALHALSERGAAPEKILMRYRTATAWAIAATLSEHYGLDGDTAVWRHIAAMFGADVSVARRSAIVEEFRNACRKLGLTVDGFDRPVDVLLFHAGVAKGQLPRLAEAFDRHARVAGVPDSTDIVVLNRWEDESLQHLPNNPVLHRPIMHDHSAWMASMFLEWRRDPVGLQGRGPYLAALHDAFETVRSERGNIVSRVNIARPMVVEGRLVVQLPPGSGRMRVEVDGRTLRLPRGTLWPVPLPPPLMVRWIEDDAQGVMDLVPAVGYAIFDAETGQRLTDAKAGPSCTVAALDIIVLSRAPFSTNGAAAQPLGPGLQAARLDLASSGVRLAGPFDLDLSGQRRTRITVSGPVIARGSKPLWGPDALVTVDRGALSGETIVLSVEDAGSAVLTLDESGRGSISLGSLLSAAGMDVEGDPVEVDLVLMRPGEDGNPPMPTRFRHRISVWPGFLVRTGTVLESVRPPRNVVKTDLRHVQFDDRGHLCLDRRGGYDLARLSFDLGQRIATFDLRPEGVTATLERGDGITQPWRMGDRLERDGNTLTTLVVRSSDRQASLRLGDRTLTNPFWTSTVWPIPLRTLDGAQAPDIVHVSAAGEETLIASVVTRETPRHFVARLGGTLANLDLAMDWPIGGVRMTIVDEIGTRRDIEASFDHLPAALQDAHWFKAVPDGTGGARISVGGDPFDGLALASLSVRGVGANTWSPLGNLRGDCFALAIPAAPLSGSGGRRRLAQLDRWLTPCYARDAWDGGLGKRLVARWTELAQTMRRTAGDGRQHLLALAHGGPEPEGWLPLTHLTGPVPDLYSAPCAAFSLLEKSAEPAGRALSVMAHLSNRLRSIEALDTHAFVAFANHRDAERHDLPLAGFNLQVLIHLLEAADTGHTAIWSGTPVLGPGHLLAGRGALSDRIEETALFDGIDADGPMSLRSVTLNVLVTALASRVRLSIELEGDDTEFRIRAEKAIVAYARAARQDAVAALISATAIATERTPSDIAAALGDLLRLGPELLSFYLIAAELERRDL
ncbi:hypothetical protein [Roseovarius sp. MBR-6]|jgi:hypothetical protein|uniref:hypothetical protein n=1 Tax=Roseovarius sp. MBR-6 TaxID=3156459 RepID=UPI0033914197